VCLSGPTLRATIDLACVLFGAPFDLEISGKALQTDKTFLFPAGEDLSIKGTPSGLRAYLCIRGGLQTPLVLGSRSGMENLERGAELPCLPGSIHTRYLQPKPRFPWWKELCEEEHEKGSPHTLRVLPGLQASWFAEEEFCAQEFTVSPASDRMGLRLHSRPLVYPDREMASEPVCPGSVQVTRDGQCIILGIDGQTIGGYPKVAQVIAADLDAVGQLRPGERVRFVPVADREAVASFRARQKVLQEWCARLRTSLTGW
jgi:antagonist of KipI